MLSLKLPITHVQCVELFFFALGFHYKASGSALSLERRIDHDGHSLAITAAGTVAAAGVPPWNWRDPSANGTLIILCLFHSIDCEGG